MSDELIYQAILDTRKQGRPAALVTVIRAQGSVPRHASSKMLVFVDGRIVGTIGGGELESCAIEAGQKVIQDGQPRLETYSLAGPREEAVGVCGGEVEVFIEPILPPPTVFVIGCGHVGQAVAHLAQWLGFQVIVSDDREALCTPEHVPDADVYLPGAITDVLSQAEQSYINNQTFIVAVTRGYPFDVEAIPILLETDTPYIGVIGSRRRWATTRQALEDKGVTDKSLKRIYSPIGLELEAETPEEIAVSIMAEIIRLRNGGADRTEQ